jgi:hypothetical protein
VSQRVRRHRDSGQETICPRLMTCHPLQLIPLIIGVFILLHVIYVRVFYNEPDIRKRLSIIPQSNPMKTFGSFPGTDSNSD